MVLFQTNPTNLENSKFKRSFNCNGIEELLFTRAVSYGKVLNVWKTHENASVMYVPVQFEIDLKYF